MQGNYGGIHQKNKLVFEVVLKAMAKILKLKENIFLEQYGEPKLLTRLHFNPKSPTPCHVRLRQHLDGSAITAVLQDKKMEGLQYLKDNQWFRAPVIPDALLINVGDVLEVLNIKSSLSTCTNTSYMFLYNIAN